MSAFPALLRHQKLLMAEGDDGRITCVRHVKERGGHRSCAQGPRRKRRRPGGEENSKRKNELLRVLFRVVNVVFIEVNELYRM